ncbi:hypothetical protein GHO42_20390 [Pseudomonas sp. FSL R10-0056]|uniref:SGNH/GDSL hydrolase family protein n=1 Tax=unclassified Pseudomonas TaxID=196821 RepID=UPI001296B626|nr:MULTISPECIES: SGNH/GDSL hydrolase family protein [unclassified Pseudomonas]MQT65420.1 hypothetical protein [Pseudomonas sp. FSL R10-0056]MQT70853.1 hypothetical protein [Pseudomonas sp. FSL R10-0071]MQU50817.1 hypothetical protein [Pseudomonas sp. FSL A6-1183]
MDYQAERLGLIVEAAEQSMDIVQRFSNDPIDAGNIQTASGPIKNLKQVSADIKSDGETVIGVAVAELIDELKTETSVSALIDGLTDTAALAEESAAQARLAADYVNAAGKIYDSTVLGLASTVPGQYFNIPAAGSSEYLILYKNEGGVAVEKKRYPSSEVVSVLASKSRFTYYENALYGSGYEGGKFTGAVVTPSKAAVSVVSNAIWAAVGVQKALRIELIAAWPEFMTKALYDANVLVDQMASIALSPATPANFHAGDTINFRMLYRSNTAAACALVIIKADGSYDSIAGGEPGRIALANTNGAISEISFSVVANSATVNQAIISPRIFGGDAQVFSIGDYIEVVDMVMQKSPINKGFNYKHPTKDNLLEQTAALASSLAAKSKFIYYTNALYATGYEGGKFTGVAATPAKATVGLVSNATWAAIGVRKALRIELISAWPEVTTKALYDANVLADKMASIALSAATPADFHAGDTVNFRMLYRSNKAAACALIIFRADGSYDSIAGGSIGAKVLPNTNGAISEISFSAVASSANASQAIIGPRIFGMDGQTFTAGDYIEVVDMVMQNSPIDMGVNYKHPTKDNLLEQTAELASSLAVKSKFIYYTNTLYATGYEGGKFTGVAYTPAKATVGLVSNATWAAIGVRKALRIELILAWPEVTTKALYDANVLADKMASIALSAATPADFHAGDTINFRMLYRSNKAATCALIIFRADGSYDSTAGGSVSAKVLPNTNGAISEISFSVVASSANARQAIIGPRIFGSDRQTFAAGDYIEVVDMVMQLMPIDSGVTYRHPTKDDVLRYVSAPAGKNIFDKNKVVPGKQVSGTGAITASATSSLSPYVYVAGLRSITVSGLQNNPNDGRYYAFYAEDKTTVISAGHYLRAGLNSGVIEVPNESFWFLISTKRVNTSPDENDAVQIERGRMATAYAGYVEGFNGIDSVYFVAPPPLGNASSAKSFMLFGDSITTMGTWSAGGVFTDLGRRPWPKIAKDLLPMGSLVNYAKSGAAYRDRAWVEDWQKLSYQVTKALEFSTVADVIVVACGTNDGIDDLGDYSVAMGKATLDDLDRTKFYEAIRWAFWSISLNWPKAVYFAATPIQRASPAPEVLEPLYTAIKKMAARYNFILIDATAESGIIRDFEVASAPGRYLTDGLHPNDEGHIKMAELFSRKIGEVINWCSS